MCLLSGFSKLYRTGDFAKIVNNELLYEGRCDSQVKIRGQRVDLSEVQAAISNLNAVQKSSVLCYKPGDLNQVKIVLTDYYFLILIVPYVITAEYYTLCHYLY